ncbi:MAG: hypothetical protein L6311_16555 [Cellulomonas sp.]|nr:hypothetical protein [Cellulomonas sp.]
MPLDANGVYQYTEADVTSPTASAFFNKLASSVSTAIGSILTALGLRGVTVAASDGTTQTGAVSADFVYATATITLTPGTWRVQGGASLLNMTGSDAASVALWNQTAGSAIAGSRGAAGTTFTTSAASLVTRPVLVTVAVNTDVRVQCARNGATSIRASFLASAPAAWLNAERVK